MLLCMSPPMSLDRITVSRLAIHRSTFRTGRRPVVGPDRSDERVALVLQAEQAVDLASPGSAEVYLRADGGSELDLPTERRLEA